MGQAVGILVPRARHFLDEGLFESLCVHVRFYFSLPLIFTLLAASISHFLTAALNFHVFLPSAVLRNSSPLFSIIRSSSFSVIHVRENIKNNAEKETTLLLFFSFLKVGVAM